MFCGWANHSKAPWEGCGQLHPSNHSSRLFSKGNALVFEPLPTGQLRLPESWFTRDRHSRDVEGLFERDTTWQHAAVALARGRLVVSIIGSSVTAGCGANEPWEMWRSNGSQLLGYHSAMSTCNLASSWGRRFHEELLQLLHHWLPHGHHGQRRHALQTTIQYKNAVDVGYFAHCTSGHVSADSHVVLIEAAHNLWGGNVSEVVQAVRSVAPAAAVAFVNWAFKSPPQIEETARAELADVVRAEVVINRVRKFRLTPACVAGCGVTAGLFARFGRDGVHPTTKGHALLGALAARHVAKRILTTGCAPGGPLLTAGAARDGGADAASLAATPTPPLPSQLRLSGDRPLEQCYTSADQLPLMVDRTATTATTPGAATIATRWKLIDEGAAKGVPKLGLASWTVGDQLDIGPLALPVPARRHRHHAGAGAGAGAGAAAVPRAAVPRAACAAFLAELGYLMSATREGQGVFSIGCVGSCKCMHIASPFPHLTPFPMVQTDAKLANDPDFRTQNISVTATTSFVVLWKKAPQPCAVRITHEDKRSMGGSSGRSRVRIDSLVLTHMSEHRWNYTRGHRTVRAFERAAMETFEAGGECVFAQGWREKEAS